MKRVVDVCFGVVLAVVTTPLVLVLAVVVALELRAWPFFVQDRVMERGRLARFPKLRTLPRRTPAYALKSHVAFELSQLRALLRRLHLDELPQLWLVVTGHLSLVGPRPRMPEAHEPVDPAYASMREAVPQGCTGLWQIGAHAHLLPHEHPEYDAAYVAGRSLRLDLWILWRTLLLVLGVGEPVRLDQLPAWARRPGTRPAPDNVVSLLSPGASAAAARPRLRLALYHPWIYLTGGVERSILELLSRSRHDWTVFTHHYDQRATFAELREFPIVELQPRVSVARSLAPLAQAAARIAATRLPLDGCRALLVSSEGLGDLVLARTRVPAVAYCHTPLKILHDPANRAKLEAEHPQLRRALAVLGPGFGAVDRLLWRRYAHVLVNSGETRRRVVAAGLAPADRLEVLHPGVDAARFPFSDGPRSAMFLVAGRIMWQKNIELAIDALDVARHQGSTAELVVAGALDEKSRGYLASLRARARDLPVRFLVNPTDAELRDLYQSCLATLFTARNEDWGIVPLEAMASGAPVLAVDAGGPRESVVHGQTGWLLRDDPTAFARRMLRVEAGIGPRWAAMRLAARERALAFDWESFAGRIDDVMEAVALEAGVGVPSGAESQIQLPIALNS